MPVLQRDTLRHTYADYLTWSRDYGDELIDGVAYIREPPSPSRRHQEFVGELYRQAANALEGKSCRACIAPSDVRLPKNGEADDQIDTVVQPDVFIVCDRRKQDERGLRGAPDWLAEVLSPTTASYDRNLKLAAYERAGVPEVWLIHPTEQTLAIYRLQDRRYGQASIVELKGQTRLSAVSGVSIDWDRLLVNIA
jgi:Uma2 family endonuclease